jgi:hypothetical protein
MLPDHQSARNAAEQFRRLSHQHPQLQLDRPVKKNATLHNVVTTQAVVERSVKKHASSIASLQSGDVLVSRSTAVREHEIRIVPNAPHAVAPTHDAAVADGRAMAHTLGVDAWLSEDQTHVVKIAAHRVPHVVVEPSASDT